MEEATAKLRAVGTPLGMPLYADEMEAMQVVIEERGFQMGSRIIQRANRLVSKAGLSLNDWDKAEWAHESRPASQTVEKVETSRLLSIALAQIKRAGDMMNEMAKNGLRESLDELDREIAAERDRLGEAVEANAPVATLLRVCCSHWRRQTGRLPRSAWPRLRPCEGW